MKIIRLILMGVVACIAGIASAGTIAAPYIAGDFQGWDPGATLMTETAPGSDIWTYTVTGLAADSFHGFKITDGTWDTTVPSADSWFIADNAGSDITLTYDGNSYTDGWSPSGDRVGVSYSPNAWNAVGDFVSEIGGVDWDNTSAPLGAMVDQGGGIYTLTVNDLTAGSYNYKAVAPGSWNAIGSDGRSQNAGNLGFTTDAVNNDVTFYVDALNGVAKVEVIPEPATLGLLGMAGVGILFVRRKFQL